MDTFNFLKFSLKLSYALSHDCLDLLMPMFLPWMDMMI